jgi:hypothetical protein
MQIFFSLQEKLYVTTQVVRFKVEGSRFKVQGWFPYLRTGVYSSFFNLEPLAQTWLTCPIG